MKEADVLPVLVLCMFCAPLSSGPQISKMEASKDSGAAWRKTSSAVIGMKPLSRTSRVTPRCGTSTPFGLPVDPEVKSK